MRLLEHPHKVAKVECFARAGSSFKNRKTMNSLAEFPDKILMPLCAVAAVVEAKRLRVEDGGERQSDCFTLNVVSPLLYQIKSPASRSGGLRQVLLNCATRRS